MQEDIYLTTSRVVTALAAIVLIIAGWLFNVMESSQQSMRDRQARYGERIAVAETHIKQVNNRVDQISRRVDNAR